MGLPMSEWELARRASSKARKYGMSTTALAVGIYFLAQVRQKKLFLAFCLVLSLPLPDVFSIFIKKPCSEDQVSWKDRSDPVNFDLFIRKACRNKDGKSHHYWILLESYRTERGPRHRTVAYLGEMDEAGRLRIQQRAQNHPGYQRSFFQGSAPEWVEVDVKNLSTERARRFVCGWLWSCSRHWVWISFSKKPWAADRRKFPGRWKGKTGRWSSPGLAANKNSPGPVKAKAAMSYAVTSRNGRRKSYGKLTSNWPMRKKHSASRRMTSGCVPFGIKKKAVSKPIFWSAFWLMSYGNVLGRCVNELGWGMNHERSLKRSRSFIWSMSFARREKAWRFGCAVSQHQNQNWRFCSRNLS